MKSHLGWYSRDYLPHFDRPGLVQGITFRLADSMPAEVIAGWRNELAHLAEGEQKAEFQRRIADYLDAGHGECLLRDERIARIVEDALLHFDGERYRLIAWVVMPNHVHSLAEMRDGWPSRMSCNLGKASPRTRRTGCSGARANSGSASITTGTSAMASIFSLRRTISSKTL